MLNKYGYTLQKIKAEWWEYKTVPAIIIDNKDIYDRLAAYSGVKIGEDYDSNRGLILHNSDPRHISSPTGGTFTYQYSWNDDLGVTGTVSTFSEYIDTLLPLLFYTGGIGVDDYTLSPETLQEKFDTYNKTYLNRAFEFQRKRLQRGLVFG